MQIEIKVLDSNTEKDYLQLLTSAPAGIFTHSLQYRKFLKKILKNAEDHYLLAYEDDELIAALPFFTCIGYLGTVVNSLPFYGSHGGIIAKPNIHKKVIDTLLNEFMNFCQKHQVVCSTLIESPFERNREAYSNYQPDYFDERIGQITSLPQFCKNDEIEDSLLRIYDGKRRNRIRKALKQGFIVSHNGSKKTFEALHALHEENIRGIGGLSKPWSVFEAIRDVFIYDQDYRIYFTTDNNQIVSAMLVFYFKGMVEYFIPATLKAYRSRQPLLLLIFTAMRDAIRERKSTHWNWGGTWLSLQGVYKFKADWGATDYPYRYHIKSYKGAKFFSGMNKIDLLNGYPYFYTVPFSVVEQS